MQTPRPACTAACVRCAKCCLGKLEGLGQYDIRRPLTPTGTNLLGLIKHLSTGEARYKKPGLWR